MYDRLKLDGGGIILPVPRVITIYQLCIKHNVPGALIERLHFNDLQLLLMRLDISEIKQILKQQANERQKARGIKEVRELSAGDAVRFLKGGGNL